MKECFSLHERVEPPLSVFVYRAGRPKLFYLRLWTPAAGTSLPLVMKNVATIAEARCAAETLFHVLRGLFRHATGEAADLPPELKHLEDELPAFAAFLSNLNLEAGNS
jgi:hypothetical protein